MSTLDTPVLGPCEAWVTAIEVAACCSLTVDSSNQEALDQAAVEASQMLYELSGQRFSGPCSAVTERPFINQNCGCFNNLLWPLSAGAPQIQISWGLWGTGYWGWGFEGCSEPVSCGALSRAKLSGYPVTSIQEVQIDGVVIDPDGYRLDEWLWLTRLADPDTLEPRYWPSCQRLDLADGQPGTWTVTYTYGYDPPLLGVQAAAQLACQLYKACRGDATCELPAGVTQIERQGISIKRSPFLSWAQQKGVWGTGLSVVDAFLSAYNPAALQRPSTVWSPDVAPASKQLG